MTQKFDILFNELIGEMKSFEELTDRPPYGYWITPDGDFHPVPFFGHRDTAYRMLEKMYPDAFRDFSNKGLAKADFYVLEHLKWVRVLCDRDDKILYYTTFNNAQPPNNTQKKTLRDIADFYGMLTKSEKY